MGIELKSNGSCVLSLAAPIAKPNLTGGAGHWIGTWMRLPTTFFASGGHNPYLYSPTGFTQGTGANDQGFGIAGPGLTPARHIFSGISSNGSKGMPTADNVWSVSPTAGAVYLYVQGVHDEGGGVFRSFNAYIPVNGASGAAVSRIGSAVAAAGYITSTTAKLLEFIFKNTSAGSYQTSVSAAVEHVICVRGNFPFSGGVPDPAILSDLACGVKNWGDATVLNGGTVLDYRRLLTTTDLLNRASGTPGGATSGTAMTVTDDMSATTPGIQNSAVLAGTSGGAAWAADNVAIDAVGAGRAYHVVARNPGDTIAPVAISGTYVGTTTGVDVRIIDGTTGIPLSGFDWTSASGFSGGIWSNSFSNVPVGGYYKIEARFTSDTSVTVTGPLFGVGDVIVLWGQSQCDLLFTRGSLAVTAGVKASVLTANNKNGTGTPVAATTLALMTGTMTGSAIVSFVNQWYADNGNTIPLMVVDSSYVGTAIEQWVNNCGPISTNITSVSNNGSGLIRCTFLSPYSYTSGQSMKFGGLDTSPGGIQGPFTLSVISSTVLDLTGSTYAGPYTGRPDVWDATFWGLRGDLSTSTSGLITCMLNACGNRATAILHMQGTSNVGNDANYAADMDTLNADFDTLINNTYYYNVMPHQRSNDGPNSWRLRNIQYQKAITGGALGNMHLLGFLNDWQMDGDGSPHEADAATGTQRGGKRLSRLAAKLIVNTSLGGLPTMTAAAFTNGTRDNIDIIMSADVKAPDGTISGLPEFYVSGDSGATFSSAGFTAKFAPQSAPVTLTIGGGSSSATPTTTA